MDKNAWIKLVAALVMLGVAVFFLVRFYTQGTGVSENAFFYDLSERKLFTGPRDAVPPIKGLNDAQEDAVRAVVISTNGNPADAASRKIAYLEMYSAELKQQMVQAQATGNSPALGRSAAQAHRFVRRVTDSRWYPLNSDEAEKIVSEWLHAGPGGGPAVICTP